MEPTPHTTSPLTVFGRIVLVLFTVLIFSFLGAKLALDYQAKLDEDVAAEETAEATATPTATETATSTPTPTATPVPVGAQLSNPFDVTEARVGDTVAGMSIVSIGAWQNSSTLEFGPENSRVQFSGEVTLSGTYEYSKGEEWSRFIFILEEASMAKLPHVKGSDYTSGFDFTNSWSALEVFGLKESEDTATYTGSATIVVKNLRLQHYPTEVTHLAELVSVISKAD